MARKKKVVEPVAEKAPAVTEEVTEKAPAVTEEVTEKAPAVTEEVTEEAPVVTEEVTEEAPVVTEEVTEEAPVNPEWTHAALAAKLEKPVQINIELEEALPEKMFTVTLVGAKRGRLHGQVNGKPFSLPTGSEITINEQLYDAVKAYITSERN